MWPLKEYRYASSPGEAVALRRQGPGQGIYIAGGTDLLLFPPACDFVVDVNRAGIGGIALTADGDLLLGAVATLQEMATNEMVAGFAGGAMARAASHCGNRPVRTTATVGGNLCNALPSADMAPVLLALDATCFIADEDSQESIPLADFFVGPRLTVLEDRLLMGLVIPAAASGWRCAGRKLTRSAEDISLVQVAVALDVVGTQIAAARVALGAVAPVPMRAVSAESLLAGTDLEDLSTARLEEIAAVAAGECEPISDHRASAAYRRDMVRVLTRRMITELLAAGGAS